MSRTFTKLFASITESTVWCEPDRIRLVWICMLAMADARGRVWASIPGLANRARVPIADAEDAINRFLSPDEYSRTPDNEGRRIEPIDGGWRLLNHEKYRSIRDEETIKESKRRHINAKRAEDREKAEKAKGVDNSRPPSTAVDRSRANAEAEAEEDKSQKANSVSDSPTIANRFDEFWSVYPKREAKRDAQKAWKAKRLDAHADALIADVKNRASNHRQWLDGFVPLAATYLRGERWNDDLNEAKNAKAADLFNGSLGTVRPGEL